MAKIKLADLPKMLLDRLASVLITALLSGIVAGIAALLTNSGLVLGIGVGLGMFGIVALIGTAVMLYYRRRHQMYVSYPDPGFPTHVLRKRMIYRIDAAGVFHFSRTIEIKALIDNVDRYTDRYLWTGGVAALPLPGDGVSEIRARKSYGIWTFYDSTLEKVLKKGESTTITANWPPIHDWRSSSPFVSTSAEERTDIVEFEIEIPGEYRESENVIIEEMRSIESLYPFETRDGRFDKNGKLTLSFPASPYRHYRVRWDWKGQPPVAPIGSPSETQGAVE